MVAPHFKSDCMRPVNLKEYEVTVPCGKCPNCLKRRASGWSFRLAQQEKVSMCSHFLTLTYDTRKVPITERGYLTLDKRDVQLFMKRLRKAHGKGYPKLVYYCCGEYGGKTWRPHYHMILFNAKVELIQEAWQNGDVHFGEVNGASVGYTLKYMTKEAKVPQHQNDDRIPEFSLMSKGIGSNYLTEAMLAWHHAALVDRMYCNLPDGRKVSMPRYYKEKIYSDEERERINHAFEIRRLYAELDEAERYAKLTPREAVAEMHYQEQLEQNAWRLMFKNSLKNKI